MFYSFMPNYLNDHYHLLIALQTTSVQRCICALTSVYRGIQVGFHSYNHMYFVCTQVHAHVLHYMQVGGPSPG